LSGLLLRRRKTMYTKVFTFNASCSVSVHHSFHLFGINLHVLVCNLIIHARHDQNGSLKRELRLGSFASGPATIGSSARQRNRQPAQVEFGSKIVN
jgi:hypothetical protein